MGRGLVPGVVRSGAGWGARVRRAKHDTWHIQATLEQERWNGRGMAGAIAAAHGVGAAAACGVGAGDGCMGTRGPAQGLGSNTDESMSGLGLGCDGCVTDLPTSAPHPTRRSP